SLATVNMPPYRAGFANDINCLQTHCPDGTTNAFLCCRHSMFVEKIRRKAPSQRDGMLTPTTLSNENEIIDGTSTGFDVKPPVHVFDDFLPPGDHPRWPERRGHPYTSHPSSATVNMTYFQCGVHK